MFYFQTVTPKHFINVLLGKKDLMKGIGSGKVIERYAVKSLWIYVYFVYDSGPDDNVFVYFTDHGAVGTF